MHVVAKHDKTIFIEMRGTVHGVKSGQESHPMMLPKMALFFPKLGQSPSTVNQQKKICVVRYDQLSVVQNMKQWPEIATLGLVGYLT